MMAATFLPEKLAWHSRAALRAADPAWTVVYAVDDQAVMLERVLGRGAIVVMSDAFLLSNEAMLLEREPALLAWLQGASSSAVFEESHLGVREVPGVAALARRYGLGPAGLVLLAIVLLHVWRKASPLVPVETTDPDEGNILAGRDSAAGFVNLLRRTLPARALFPSCLAEYRHGSAWRRLNPELRRQLEELARSPVGHDPVEASVRAHRLLDRRFRAPPPSSP